jgi:hypothetical protein
MLASSSPYELKWPTPAEAAEHRFTDGEKTALAKAVTGYARGGPETIKRWLTGLVERVSPDELLVTTLLYDLEDRVRSHELLTDHVVTPVVPGAGFCHSLLRGNRPVRRMSPRSLQCW